MSDERSFATPTSTFPQPTPVSRGALIVLEGPDKSGKSTQTALLRDALVAHGWPVGTVGAPGKTLREPGGTPAGEDVRELLLHRAAELGPWTEALLYAAARAQLVREIVRPSLVAGWVVVLDRYIDSSLAYQGCARGLGIDVVLDLNLRACDGLLPDLTVVIEVGAVAAAQRQHGAPDRIEREGRAFQEAVARGYRELAARFPERVRVVDGERPQEAVAADVASLALACLEAIGVR